MPQLHKHFNVVRHLIWTHPNFYKKPSNMQKATEYQIVTGKSPNELTQSVNELIKNGWVPTGGVFIVQSPVTKQTPNPNYVSVETWSHQAMIKVSD
jgi:hypothetical protein